MSFAIVIRADTSQVLPAVAAVGAELGKTEAKAKSTTTALDDGFKKSSVSAEKLARSFKGVADAIRAESLNSVGKSFEGLTAQFEREANILERIRGPMREYKADLDTLDLLMKQGKISAQEYNEELSKVIDKQGTMQGPQQQQSGGGGGFRDRISSGISSLTGGAVSGEMMVTGGAIAAGALVAAEAVNSLMASYRQAQDEYIGMANAARKFTDASRDTNDIMKEQLALSESLHSDFHTTIELYDSIRDGTDEMNLTHGEQIRLTQTLGEAMTVANKPIGESSGLMSKLAFAMSSGHIEGRELKAIMTQLPEIGDLWASKFNTDKIGIRRMVDQGRISVRDLTNTLIENGAQIDAMFAKYSRTNAQIRTELMDRAKVLADGGIVGPFQAMSAAAEMAAGKVTTVSSVVQTLTDQMEKLKTATTQAADQMNRTLDEAMRGLGKGAVPGAAGTLQSSILGPVMGAREDLATLQQLYKSGAIDAEQYRQKYDQFMTTINDGRLPETIKLWEGFRQPQQEWARSIGALNTLLAAGSITLREYNSELSKLAAANPIDNSKVPSYVGGRNKGGVEYALGYERAEKYNPIEQSKLSLKGLGPDTALTDDAFKGMIDNLMGVQQALLKDKTLTEQWNAELARLNRGVGAQTLTGLKNGFNEINKQIDVSAQATKTLVDAFDSVGNAITDLVTKGTIDWHSMIESMLADMTKLLLYQGLRQLIGGGGGSAVPGLFGSIPGFASGGSYMTGGSGGTDSQINLFRTTPGEQVIIRTPEQQRAATQPQANMHATVINTFDHRQAALAALNSREGAAIVKNIVAQSAGQLRAHITKR